MKSNAVVMISQPRYLPCLNFLARINSSDYYVVMDNVQRVERGFENRNKIVVGDEPKWLTIPVVSSSRELISLSATDDCWINAHFNTILSAYSSYEHFDINLLHEIFKDVNIFMPSYISTILKVLQNTLKLLEINTELLLLSDFETKSKGYELMDETLDHFKNPLYVSGVNGLDYGIQNIKNRLYIDDMPYIHYTNSRKLDFPYMAFIDCLFSIGLEKTIALIKKNSLQI